MTQTDKDSHSSARFTSLTIAATWAFTQWSVPKTEKVFRGLVLDVQRDLERARIRGEQFDEGSANLELAPGIELKLSGGADFGLSLMIDASAAQ